MPLLVLAMLIPFVAGAVWPRISTFILVFVLGSLVLMLGGATLPSALIDCTIFLIIAVLGAGLRSVLRPSGAA